MNNSKRIHSVTIKRMVDESPDTSWLGEYANRPTSEFSIDREHALDCMAQTYNSPTGEGSDHLQNAIEYLEEQYEADDSLPWEQQNHSLGCTSRQDTYAPCSCEFDKYQIGNTDARVILEGLRDAECTCGHSGDKERNEYRYFNPSFNYVDKSGHALPENSPKDVQKYVRQDYERMESLNRGNWCFVGIRAEAEYSIGEVRGGRLIQELSSGGLWGIESDSEGGYFADVEKEELAELRAQLQAIGFSKRAVSAAFREIEHKEE